MKGFVPTPIDTVDTMVATLFRGRPPTATSTILDPGCGTGAFIDGVIRWCDRQALPLPSITGVESDPRHLRVLRAKYKGSHVVRIEHRDFLSDRQAKYDYIVGNPPYVPITSLSEVEKARYRERYATARGRFDLYLLFFEQAIRCLASGGRLVFITPEKYLYVDTAGPLREILARFHVEEIRFVPEDTFGELVTYPTITTLRHGPPGVTKVVRRDGPARSAKLPATSDSWLPVIEGYSTPSGSLTLGDLCRRLSCGVATGADSVFVRPAAEIEPRLQRFARPTVAGRELKDTTELAHRFVMLTPYDVDGRLIPIERLGALRSYLQQDDVRRRLLARTCVAQKPWYAFHETPPFRDLLQPKILCKDIGERPQFWIDRSGTLVPRHSVYYIVPHVSAAIDVIAEYLRSPFAIEWLLRNCQRASKGFVRLQSNVLRRLPVPEELAETVRGMKAFGPVDPRRNQAALAV